MPRRVLLIDDNLAVQKLVELTLRKEGFEVTPVDNGLSALDIALKNPPDLILADFNLEGMNIFTFIQKIRQKERLKEIPIALLINSTETYDPAQLESAGIQAFLKKPIDSKELVEQVKRQTGTSETVMMDLNALSKKDETQLSEQFSNPGNEAVKIEELLGWSSPGALAPSETTQEIRIEPAAPTAPEAVQPGEAPQEVSQETMEETQHFQLPPMAAMTSPREPLPEAPPLEEEEPASSVSTGVSPAPETDGTGIQQDAPLSAPPVDRTELEIAIRKSVSEAVEKVARETLPSLIESPVMKEKIASILEKIAWEVVPALAEIEIKKEIKRLQAEEN